jgi:DNA (cytosine-5)-methyltransferase 1
VKPVLYDLMCLAGGATKGYQRAGFHVVGVDLVASPNYCGDEFIRADALSVDLSRADVIHVSPPCQTYSTQTAVRSRHPELITPVRELLATTGLPYVIENVEAARWAMRDPIRLCGSSFGLDLRRHRLFESNMTLTAPPCDHVWQTPRFRSLDHEMVKAGRLASVVGVHGHINYVGESELRQRAMGIDWMTNAELVEAIPPDYTEHIGHQLMEGLK